MQRSLEISEVFKNCSNTFLRSLSLDKQRVYSAITACRSSKLGAHIRYCSSCNYKEQAYNSCRNRHCPKCQGSISANWTKQRNKELLPVEYFHSVFTIPKELRSICYQNKKVFYEIMFRSVSETLNQVAANPKFLGAKIGFITILHSWNQKLEYHPHIHVISPKGGLSNNEWISSQHNFFLPVRALSKVYRGKLIDYLRKAYKDNELNFFGSSSIFKQRTEKDIVSFSYRDSRNQYKKKTLTLNANTFTKRFLLHVIPKNFTRIRHYGLLASANKAKALEKIRNLLNTKIKRQEIKPLNRKCPKCLESELKTLVLDMIPHRKMPLIPKSQQYYETRPPPIACRT